MTKRDGMLIGRRAFISGAAASGGFLLGGCDALGTNESVRSWLDSAENLNRYLQRQLSGEASLAPEYAEADLSPQFRANGSTSVDDAEYRRHFASGFNDWRLQIVGEIEQPMELSLADLRAMPARSQITRHDCVEGWSCIGKWRGVPLAHVLARVKVKPAGRYVVFHCADNLGDGQYFESIDLIDAVHPQTILAYDMNGSPLKEEFGAPVRLRLERQLGYKMAKFVMRIELATSLSQFGAGKGSYWADRGYEWYAGI